MKNNIKKSIFRSFIAAMTLFCSFKITNAQTTTQNTPTTGDTTAILKEKSISVINDTFLIVFQVAKASNDSFKGAFSEFNIDTIRGIDTSLKSFNVNWVDLFVGHLDYVSRVKMISTVNGKIYYSNKEYWSLKGPLKRFDLSLDKFVKTNDGCIPFIDINNGRPTEKDTTFFDWRLKSTDKWRTFKDTKIISTGIVKGASISLTGLGENTDVQLRARGANPTGGDTIYWNLKTGKGPALPVIDLDSLFHIGGNTGYGSYRIYGNIPTNIWAMRKNTKTGITDSLFLKNVKSDIQEMYKFTFSTVGYNVKYEVTLWAEDSLGKVHSEMRWLITPDMPVPTTIKSLPPIIYAGGIKAVFSYTMPNDNMFSSVNLKLWTNSSLSGAAKSIPVAKNLTQSGTFTGEEEIPLEKGKYYGYYTTDDIKGVWPTSDTFMFEVKFTAGIQKLSLSTEPVECRLFDLSGKMISESYIVNPKINLFDPNLPNGIIIARPIGKFSPFKIFNHQEGGM